MSSFGGQGALAGLLVVLLLAWVLAGGGPAPGTAPASTPPPRDDRDAKPAPAPPACGRDPKADPVFGLLCRFYGVDDREEAGQRFRGAGSKVLIATISDPIDSHVGYSADQEIDAVRTAVATAGYHADRFYLPWRRAPASKETAAETCEGLDRHRCQPGALLFRSGSTPASREAGPELLLVLLVGETPTAGVHRGAYWEALDLATNLSSSQTLARHYDDYGYSCSECPADRCPTNLATNVLPSTTLASGTTGAECGADSLERLVVVGPMYSGTAWSLRLLAGQWFESKCDCPRPTRIQLDYYSGNATNDALREILGDGPYLATGEPAGSRLERKISSSFHSTNLPDCVLEEELLRQLEGVTAIALLGEAGTPYGSRGERGAQPGPTSHTPCQQSAPKPTPPRIIALSYPLHVSQIRAAYHRRDGGSGNGTLNADARAAVPLPIGPAGDFEDAPPSFNPENAATAADLMLSDLLETIQREPVPVVAIKGTDTYDKLFLARLVRRYAPNAQLVLFEGDVLYAHPSLAPDLLGARVISAYPLSPLVQRSESPARRVPFASSATQAIHNAVLAALSSLDVNGIDREAFSAYFDAQDRPGPRVWSSVVGRTGLWPLAVEGTTSSGKRGEWPVAMPKLPSADKSPEVPIRLPLAFRFLLLTSCLLTIGAAAVYGYLAFRPLSSAAKDSLPAFAWHFVRDDPRSRAWVLVFFALTGGSALYLIGTVGPAFAASAPWSALHGTVLLGLVGVGASLAFVLVLLLCKRATFKPDTAACLVDVILVVALIGLLPACLGATLPPPVARPSAEADCAPTRSSDEESLWSFERAAIMGSGVSPVRPAVLLALGALVAVYGWGYRSQIASYCFFVEPVLTGDDDLYSIGRRVGASLGLRNPWRVVSRGDADERWFLGLRTLPAMIFTLGVTSFLWPKVYPSASLLMPEGRAFHLVVSAVFLALTFLAVLWAAQCLCAWWALRRLLRTLAWSPLAEAFDRLPQPLARTFGFRLSSEPGAVAELRYAESQAHLSKWADLVSKPCARLNLTDFEQASQQARIEAAGHWWRSHAYRSAAQQMWSSLAGCVLRALERKASPGSVGSNAQSCVLRALRRVRIASRGSQKWSPPPTSEDSDRRDIVARHQQGLRDEREFDLRLAEEFVAMQITTYIGYVFGHLKSLLSSASVISVLLVLAVASYPFQPQRLLTQITVALLLVVVGVAVVVMVQADRNEILSRIANRPPNRVTFDRQFLGQVLTYAVLPIATAIVTQFPGLSGGVSSLVGWFTR